MMIGVPSIEIPRWPVVVPPASSHTQHQQLQDDSSASPSPSRTTNLAAFAVALQRFLPRYNNDMRLDDYQWDGDCHDVVDDDVPLLDAFTCDEFRMYEFKVRRCARGRSHDWTQCPYAHPGEKACRRDPRKFHYSGSACPEFRKGNCRKGDSCEFAHGVFECWLHPSRYRTQPCKDGIGCRRRVCFFAHTPEQLRVLPTVEGYDGSPMRKARGGGVVLSPTSSLAGPVSPSGSSGVGSPPVSPTVDEVVLEMRKLQMCNRAKEQQQMRGMAWDLRHQQQQMRHGRTRGFDRWYGEPVPEKANLAEGSVDEPAWFSDIVN